MTAYRLPTVGADLVLDPSSCHAPIVFGWMPSFGLMAKLEGGASQKLLVNGKPSFITGTYGPCLGRNSAQGYYFNSPASESDAFAWEYDEISVLVIGRKTAVGSSNFGYDLSRTNGSSAISWYVSTRVAPGAAHGWAAADSTNVVHFAGSGNQVFQHTPYVGAFSKTQGLAVYTPYGMSSSATGWIPYYEYSANPLTGARCVAVGNALGTVTGTSPTETALAVMFKGWATQRDAALLLEDPFRMFKPRRRPVFTFPQAASGFFPYWARPASGMIGAGVH